MADANATGPNMDAWASRQVGGNSPRTSFRCRPLIIASAFSVFRKFGYGFLEPVYRRALAAELRHRGVRIDQEVHFELFHHSEPVGSYRADLIVDARVIVETKAGAVLDPNAPVQLLNYLCAARLSLGLVVHFGPKGARVKRVVASNFRTFQAARDGPNN